MSRKLPHRLFAAYLGITTPALALADELDDAFGGFDEISTPELKEVEKKPEIAQSRYGVLTGSLALSSSYNFYDHYSSTGTDWEGLSKLRTRVNLEYNNQLADNWQMRVSGYSFYDSAYALRDRDNYSDAVLDSYEAESEFQEVWVLGKLSSQMDIKVGRQIVVWGRADSYRVLDILNPIDNREPGLVDIEDLRLPVAMVKADYFFTEEWQSSLIVIPEIRFSKNPPIGSDFEIIPAIDFEENEPEDFKDSSYAAAVTGVFSGWDISFHAARYWRDAPYLNPQFDPLNFANPLQGSTLEHSRLTMLGMGGNYTKGAWLLKGELAWLDGVDYSTTSVQNIVVAPGPIFAAVEMPTGTVEKNRVDALVGIEYFGISNSSLSVELVQQYIPDFKDNMQLIDEEKNTTSVAFRATHSTFNDRLDLTLVVFGAMGDAGGGERFDAEYDIMDALTLKAGVIFYEEGDKIPFNSYYDNDRVFAELKYSF